MESFDAAVYLGPSERSRDGCHSVLRFTHSARVKLFFLTGAARECNSFFHLPIERLRRTPGCKCVLRAALCEADLLWQMVPARSAAPSLVLGDEAVDMFENPLTLAKAS